MHTIFPLVSTRPASSASKSRSRFEATEKKPKLSPEQSWALAHPPQYLTELAITQAIANRSFNGFAATAYAEAKRYQAALKASMRPMFFPHRKGAPVKPGTVFIPGYAQ